MATLSAARSEWLVDLATGRIFRRNLEEACDSSPGLRTLNATRASGEEVRMSDEKERDQARKDLNPIEDIKGAIRFIKDLDPIEEVKEFMETAAKVLDPAESDLRVVEPEEDTISELEEKR